MLVRSYSRYSRPEITGEGYRQVGTDLCQCFLHCKFMDLVGIAVQKADRHRLRTRVSNAGCNLECVVLVEGGEDFAPEVQSFLDLEDSVPRHEGRGFAVLEVVHRIAVGPAQFVHVAKPACGDDCDVGSGARQKRVDAEGRAVYEVGDFLRLDYRLIQSGQNPGGGIRRYGLHLFEPVGTGRFVQDADIREGTANVNCYMHENPPVTQPALVFRRSAWMAPSRDRLVAVPLFQRRERNCRNPFACHHC